MDQRGASWARDDGAFAPERYGRNGDAGRNPADGEDAEKG